VVLDDDKDIYGWTSTALENGNMLYHGGTAFISDANDDFYSSLGTAGTFNWACFWLYLPANDPDIIINPLQGITSSYDE